MGLQVFHDADLLQLSGVKKANLTYLYFVVASLGK